MNFINCIEDKKILEEELEIIERIINSDYFCNYSEQEKDYHFNLRKEIRERINYLINLK